MKLKKIPWKVILPAVAGAARELLGKHGSEPPSLFEHQSDISNEMSAIRERIRLLEASQMDQAALKKRFADVSMRSSIAMWASLAALAISATAFVLVVSR